MMRRTGLAGMALLLLLAVHGAAEAQSIRGRLAEQGTGDAVAAGRVTVRAEATGRTVGSAVTDAEGRFAVAVSRPGTYLVEVSHAGFAATTPVAVELEAHEEVLVELVVARQVVVLEPLVVTGRRRDPRHEPSWEGALVRRELYGRWGSQRVYMHEDIEMRAAMNIVDVTRGLTGPLRGTGSAGVGEDGPRRTRAGCTIVYQDGSLVLNPLEAAWLLDTPPAHVEAVEVYRTWYDAPQGMRAVPMYVQSPGRCSVIALWSRTGTHPDDPAGRGRVLARALVAAGIAVLMFKVVPGAL